VAPTQTLRNCAWPGASATTAAGAHRLAPTATCRQAPGALRDLAGRRGAARRAGRGAEVLWGQLKRLADPADDRRQR
jgi:hypothetical protein